VAGLGPAIHVLGAAMGVSASIIRRSIEGASGAPSSCEQISIAATALATVRALAVIGDCSHYVLQLAINGTAMHVLIGCFQIEAYFMDKSARRPLGGL
jgi:hypothetical protein